MKPVTSSHGLVERVKQGDQDAFSRLFEKYRQRLAVLVHYKLGPNLRRDADVDDVLRETLLRAYRDIEQFDYQRPGSFMSWLAGIAGHVIVDMARTQDRQKRAGEHVRFRSESNPGGPEPAHSNTPSRIFTENESLGRFVETLSRLPQDYRRDCQSRGEAPDLDSFCQQNAALLPELRVQLQTVQRIDAVLDFNHAAAGDAAAEEAMPDCFSGLRVVDELGSGGMGTCSWLWMTG